MATEQQVRIAAKMYETRTAVKRIRGDKWPADFAEFSGYIRGAMAKWKVRELKAVSRLIEHLQRDVPGSEMTQMMMLAAAVEMVEPSEGKHGSV